MTKIKICGMTREDDVDLAVALGVDAVGFVLWSGSPRGATPALAARLVRRLPAFVAPVAVLVDPTHEDLARAVDEVGCRVVQIHGHVDDRILEQGRWSVVRAAALAENGDGIVPAVADGVDVLLDAHDPERRGGTGRTIDWARAAAVASCRRVILAGGLYAGNVARAVRAVRPYGVDVASGVERQPGEKDAAAMKAFVDAVRSVE